MARTTAMTLMAMVKEALRDELQKAGALDSLCEDVMLVHGDIVVIDYVECGGMAYVRLSSANPTQTFPNPAPAGSCAHTQAYAMEVGIMREAPGISEGVVSKELPGSSEHDVATMTALEDMDIMHKALRVVERSVADFELGGYTPVGPAGGAVGGNWTFTVGEDLED